MANHNPRHTRDHVEHLDSRETRSRHPFDQRAGCQRFRVRREGQMLQLPERGKLRSLSVIVNHEVVHHEDAARIHDPEGVGEEALERQERVRRA